MTEYGTAGKLLPAQKSNPGRRWDLVQAIYLTPRSKLTPLVTKRRSVPRTQRCTGTEPVSLKCTVNSWLDNIGENLWHLQTHLFIFQDMVQMEMFCTLVFFLFCRYLVIHRFIASIYSPSCQYLSGPGALLRECLYSPLSYMYKLPVWHWCSKVY